MSDFPLFSVCMLEAVIIDVPVVPVLSIFYIHWLLMIRFFVLIIHVHRLQV